MEKKPKMGRPSLPKTRSEIYPVRLLPEERAKYEEIAEKEGIPLSEWIRSILRKAAK